MADYAVDYDSSDYILNWSDDILGVYGAATDRVSIFAMEGLQNEDGRNTVKYKYVGETTRSAGTYTIDPAELADVFEDTSDVRFVVCVSRVDGTMVSNSQAEHFGA